MGIEVMLMVSSEGIRTHDLPRERQLCHPPYHDELASDVTVILGGLQILLQYSLGLRGCCGKSKIA